MNHPFEENPANNNLRLMILQAMERDDVIPKNPWNSKKCKSWAAQRGCKMNPIRYSYRCGPSHVLARCPEGFVSVHVKCKEKINKYGQSMGSSWMCVHIPIEFAERMLALGFCP
jgi:hypothetical protein